MNDNERAVSLVAALVVIAVIAIAAVGGYLAFENIQTAGLPTITSITSDLTASTTANTTCIVTGGPDGVYLRIVTDSGSPVSGVNITGEAIVSINWQLCNEGQVIASTNSTGWASLGDYAGNYGLHFLHSGTIYNMTVDTRPVAMTLDTFSVPSGNLSTQYCMYGNMQLCSG
ncbi:MAG: hypothetical protein ACYCPW_03375 [Nitrososphaerales archaeon]